MNSHPLAQFPQTVSRTGARPDNVALVPASLLPFKEEWQAMANNLPDGDVLIVLPAADRPQRRILETVALLLEGDGYHVTTVPAERFGSRH